MPEPVHNLNDLKRELARLQPGQKYVLCYAPFAAVFSGSWETDAAARHTAHQLAQDNNCVIDDYAALRSLAFRKL